MYSTSKGRFIRLVLCYVLLCFVASLSDPYPLGIFHLQWGNNGINSLAPGMKFMSTSCEIAPKRIPQNTFDDKSTLVQVMAWCLMAPSHYLTPCWTRSMSPYVITRPQWVNAVYDSPPVQMKYPWKVWLNKSPQSTDVNDNITTTKQSQTASCAYSMGYTVMNSTTTTKQDILWDILSIVISPSFSRVPHQAIVNTVTGNLSAIISLC